MLSGNDFLLVSIETNSAHSERRLDHCDVWRPELAPDPGLQASYENGVIDWHEFVRRYTRELRLSLEYCEHLRALACDPGLVFVSSATDIERCAEAALAQHLERLECEHRWSQGLMIGGYVYPVREEIMQAGGLWFARHKAWMMPDREAWLHIQSQLPGDF
ncbi:MAG: DUF488 family protein [Planctomycetaceae bacterium]|nr:DUF488 family protein [Planctomycetaceae bacterium]